MSSDPNDLAALTPGHFIIGEPLTAQPSQNTHNEKISTLQRWRLVNHLKDQFWKWKTQSTNVKTGTVVIIKEDNTPPLCWPLGRITKTFEGCDGFVRVAEVKTASGSLKPAIHRLAPLFPEDIPSQPTLMDTDDQIQAAVNTATSTKLTEGPHSPIKKRRVTTNKYLATIIAVILCLPIILCNSIKITKYADQPGIHFESMGRIHTVSSYWNLIIYYDLQPVKTELFALKRGTRILKTTCLQLNHELCDDLLPQFTQAANELELDNRLFVPSRVRRGTINVIGNIANSLFGALDSEYAEQMSRSLSEIEGNEQILLQLLKNQTSIIDSTINIMKTDQEKVKSKFDSIDRTVT